MAVTYDGETHRQPPRPVFELLPVLTTIALLDSTSMIPLCIVFLIVLLSGPDPKIRSLSLLAGIFVAYTACSLLVLFGLDTVFDAVSEYALRLWQNPRTEELLFQIIIGLVLLVFGLKVADARERSDRQPEASPMTAGGAFVAGVVMTVVGMPGAVPLLAAVDLVLRNDLGADKSSLVIVYYNVVFILPLLSIVALDAALGERSKPVLESIKGFFERWGRRLIIGLLIALGFVLVLDGVAWFLGRPLLPV